MVYIVIVFDVYIEYKLLTMFNLALEWFNDFTLDDIERMNILGGQLDAFDFKVSNNLNLIVIIPELRERPCRRIILCIYTEAKGDQEMNCQNLFFHNHSMEV